MVNTTDILNRVALINLCGLAFFLVSQMPTYAQQGSYSATAQNILDREHALNAEASIEADIFKFSINEILSSAGIPRLNANGDPEIFGRTDYGSEFELVNDLSTSSEIQIPAFVIDVLAEDKNGEYLPVIVNGFSDEDDGNYTRSYANDELNAYVEETFNSDGPNVVSYQYDNRTEVQYLPDEGVTVTHNLYSDGGTSKYYFEENLSVYTETNSSGYNFTNYYDYSTENPIFAIEYNYDDGAKAFEISDNNERFFQRTNSDGTTEFIYSEDQLEIGQSIQNNGNSTNYVTKTDELGNTQTIRQMVIPDGVITLEYDENEAAILVSETYIRDTPVINEDGTQTISYSGSTGGETHIIEEIVTENGDSSFSVDGVIFIENVGEVVSKTDRVDAKDSLIQQLETLVEGGEETISLSENFSNTNSRSIDFKDVYDEVNGQAITPELGYVRLREGEENQYINLSTGDVVEFFVRPTDSYLENHSSSSELFFIDRPIAENPVVAKDSTTTENTIYVGPGEEAITLPSGEIRVYVTTVYVQAPASKFVPSQVVMPVTADGDYNYDIEPAAAETFPDEVEVVAIPEEEAEAISAKVKQIKKAKETPQNPKHDEDTPPAIDPGIEAMIKLNINLNDVQKAPAKLISETKKNIQKDFPNISDELINLIINMANSVEKFDLISDPKTFLDKEFSKVSNPQNLVSILNADLSEKELTKIYNIIRYSFFSELTELGFETLENQKVEFSNNIVSPDQIVEQLQLQKDLLPLLSLLGSEEKSQSLASLLKDPLKEKPDSSTALFESGQSQKILGKMINVSKVINLINRGPNVIPTSEVFLNNDIPIIEVNVGVGESIANALEKKLDEDKRLNRKFQPRGLSSRLEKYSFQLPPQVASSVPLASPPLLGETPTIADRQLQLVAETTEATNNILDETVTKMLKELGEETQNDNSAEPVAATNNVVLLDQVSSKSSETAVFNNALSTVRRLQEIGDIRAIFQILGIGS